MGKSISVVNTSIQFEKSLGKTRGEQSQNQTGKIIMDQVMNSRNKSISMERKISDGKFSLYIQRKVVRITRKFVHNFYMVYWKVRNLSMAISMGSGIDPQNTSQKNQDTLPNHLGGHLNKTHNDRGAFLFIKEKFDIKSMLDVGCGPGGMVELAEMRGVEAMGIDGDFTLDFDGKNVLLHDFTTGPAPVDREFDLAWSVEFLEHVEEEYIPNFMAAFQKCKYVVCTAAPPGWNGHHHVNLQPQEYWVEKFAEYGFEFDESMSIAVRNQSTMVKGFMGRTGMFYRRK